MFLITGGGTGIGRALAIALANKGNTVLIVGRRIQPLKETCTHSQLITHLIADISTAEGHKKIIHRLNGTSKLKGLIHCAAVASPISTLKNIKKRDWNKAIEINLNAPLFLTQALLPKLQDNGRVLYLFSKLMDPIRGLCAYTLSKTALNLLGKTWQLELNEENTPEHATLLTGVMPGFVDTELRRKVEELEIDPMARASLLRLRQKNLLLPPETSALFLSWLLLDVPAELYASREWDIYDASHHKQWLVSPHTLPDIPNDVG